MAEQSHEVPHLGTFDIPGYHFPFQVYRAPAFQPAVIKIKDGVLVPEPYGDPVPERLLFAMSPNLVGPRYSIDELRSILETAEQIERDLGRV